MRNRTKITIDRTNRSVCKRTSKIEPVKIKASQLMQKSIKSKLSMETTKREVLEVFNNDNKIKSLDILKKMEKQNIDNDVKLVSRYITKSFETSRIIDIHKRDKYIANSLKRRIKEVKF